MDYSKMSDDELQEHIDFLENKVSQYDNIQKAFKILSR